MVPTWRRRWESARPGRGHPVDAVCVAPWVALEFDPSGWVYTCCANQQYPLGRIGEDRLSELWGGPRARVLRDALMTWDMSVGCNSCRWHLEHGRTEIDAAVYDRYPVVSSEPAGPVAMTFALSNRCNLACVMCSPELSSTLRHRRGMPPLHSPYDDAFFEELAPMLPGLHYAKFLGGEPFLVPEHHRVWDLMEAAGAPSRIQVTTNGTVWNERVEQLLDRFLVDITVSIDAVSADVYESIRVGADHAIVWRNLDRFRQQCVDRGTQLCLCFCLMSSNWQELVPFLDLARGFDADVVVNVVSDSGLSLHDLSTSRLEDVLESWTSSPSVRGGQDRYIEVLHTQIAAIQAVLLERRIDGKSTTRRPLEVPSRFLTPAEGGGRSDLDRERRFLASWSGGEVGELSIDEHQNVSEVVVAHHRLGLDDDVVGRPVSALVEIVAAADGRAAWMLGSEDRAGRSVRVMALSEEEPVRGCAGSIIRWTMLNDAAGRSVLLVAEDRIYDGEPSTSSRVVISPRPARRGEVKTSLTIMMPMLNEEATVDAAVRAAVATGRDLCRSGLIDGFEVVVVDDGSTDGTGPCLQRLTEENPELSTVTHPRNLGVGAAMRSGFGAATGDLVFYTDADLPVNLDVIGESIRVMRREGADVVAGYRRSRTGDGLKRSVYSAIYGRLVRHILGLRVRDVNFAAKLLRRSIFDEIELRSDGILIDAELLARADRAGFRIAQMEMEYQPRRAGTSTAARLDRIAMLVQESVRLVPDIRRQARARSGI